MWTLATLSQDSPQLSFLLSPPPCFFHFSSSFLCFIFSQFVALNFFILSLWKQIYTIYTNHLLQPYSKDRNTDTVWSMPNVYTLPFPVPTVRYTRVCDDILFSESLPEIWWNLFVEDPEKPRVFKMDPSLRNCLQIMTKGLFQDLTFVSYRLRLRFSPTYLNICSLCQARNFQTTSLFLPNRTRHSYLTFWALVVTVCTTSLTLKYSTFCPHSAVMCCVWISEQMATVLYSIYSFL